jgi:hypothetical protein
MPTVACAAIHRDGHDHTAELAAVSRSAKDVPVLVRARQFRGDRALLVLSERLLHEAC